MSNSEDRLREVARDTTSERPLEHGPLSATPIDLIGSYIEQRSITRHDIAGALKSFVLLSGRLMPADAVDTFIRERTESATLPDVFEKDADFALLPGWASEKPGLNVWESPGVLNRKQSLEKYTYEEVLAASELAIVCPEIPYSLFLFQTYIEEYIIELRKKIAEVEPKKADALERFQYHWADAANFIRGIFMGLAIAMQDDRHAGTIDSMNQETITRAFRFLEEIGAFDFEIPAMPAIGIEKATISCPAHPLLQELFVKKGTYMAVIEKVRKMRGADTAEASNDTRMKKALEQTLLLAGTYYQIVKEKNRTKLLAFSASRRSRIHQP